MSDAPFPSACGLCSIVNHTAEGDLPVARVTDPLVGTSPVAGPSMRSVEVVALGNRLVETHFPFSPASCSVDWKSGVERKGKCGESLTL